MTHWRYILVLLVCPLWMWADEIPTQCFDFTNLRSPYCKCYEGTDAQARTYQQLERIITIPDTYTLPSFNVISEDSPYEQNRPKSTNRPFMAIGFDQVPPGYDKAVRIGDYESGWGAASIEYTFRVDTTDNPVFIMHLAPVLQNSHKNGAGMKVWLQDTQGRLINPKCLSLTMQMEDNDTRGHFPGNPEWKTAGDGNMTFQYLEWPAFGIDLTPYHGEVLTLVVLSYDCAEGAHMGYGYFTTECAPKKIEVFTCGNYYELTAPAGFFYRWTAQSNPNHVLSTTQKFIPSRNSTDSIYYCEMYITEEGECSFTLPVTVHPNTPVLPEDLVQYDTVCLSEPYVLYDDTIRLHSVGDTIIYGKGINVDCNDSVAVERYLHIIDCLQPCAPDTTLITGEICEGSAYIWNGTSYYLPGRYTQHFINQAGCDSVAILNLSVHSAYLVHDTQTGVVVFGEQHRDDSDLAPQWDDPYWDKNLPQDTSANPGVWDDPYTDLPHPDMPHPDDTTPQPPAWDDPYTDQPIIPDTICKGDFMRWHGRLYSETGVFIDTLQSVFGCDSITMLGLFVKDCSCDTTYSFTDTTFIYDSLQVHPFVWFEKEYTDPGVYADTLINGNAQGCDSIGRLLLRVTYKDSLYACGDEQVTFHTPWGEYESQPDCECLTGYPLQTSDGEWLVEASLCVNRLITDTVREDTILCFGTSIEWHGKTIDQTHEYEFHEPFQRLLTCDSVVYYLNATIKDEPVDHPTTTSVCAGTSYTWTTYHDSLITAPGIYHDTLWTDHGCYSDTYILTLTHKAHSTGDTTAYVCYGDLPYLWHGKSLTESCDTSWTTINSAGCDSIVKLHLFVGPEPKKDLADTTLCYGDRIDWHGQTINAEGTYYDTARVTMGNGSFCDSIWYELAVTIQKSDTTPSNISICAGSEYVWKRAGKPDSVIRKAGEYWDTVRYVQTGCDSMIYHLTLQVEDINRDSVSAETCANTPYLWRGQSLTAEGIYRDTATAKTVTECDTIYTLKLIIKAHSTGDTTAYICYGDLPYLWHGKSLTESCDTSWTTINSAGCDSVVKLHLFVGPEPKDDLADTTLCYGDRIDWHGQTINAEGTYYDTARVTMGNGLRCDSIWYELAVTIQKSDTTPSNISICAGSEYVWKRAGKPDSVIRKAGEYWDTVRYVQTGCDSMIYHLTLQVEDINRDSISAETCANTPYLWRGQSLTAEGIYRDTATAKTVTECDTVYTLRLTINQPTIGDTIVMACDSFTWHGVTYTESTNTATWTTTNIAGCDSIVTLHLTINHASSSETNISICPEELPYTWNGKDYTAEGDYTYRTINAAGCDSTATLHLKVIQCCPDTIMRRTKLSICDTLMPYTWVTWREVVVEKTGSFADTLRNDLGCDSIIYTLTLDTFHCCAPLMAAIDVPDYICADAPYLPIEVKLLSGECASYSLHFTNPALNKMPFRDTTITIDVQYASDEPFILDIPVPDDPDDSTHYVRPDDNYKVSLTLHDRCGNSIIFGDSIFSVYYPSWVTDQHWDDVIALLNDRYNGGYTFSSVQWLRDGEELAGEDGLYIYLPHELWTNPSHQYQSYFYQALLTRTDDGKTLPTCPLEPWHIDNTNVLSDPYVSVTPTLVPKENPVVHVMTNTEGTYWIYDPAGKLLQTADYEPCEHSAFDIRLYCVQTMYILVFTPRNEKNPLQHKYSVVKVLVE